ncbi:MAG: uncharacterized protein QOG77_3299 [Solirubrobacteraceae bacterium]|nr:uncharacterized protein [Solirubrobacteraceae bacterium]
MTVDLSAALRDSETGPALAAAAEGRLLLRRCRACRDAHYHPRVPCPFCGSDELEWEQAAGTGRIYSYSVTHQGPEPYVIAYVTLTEGPTLMTNIVDTPQEELAVDLEVELVMRETPHGIHAPFFRARRAS